MVNETATESRIVINSSSSNGHIISQQTDQLLAEIIEQSKEHHQAMIQTVEN